MSDWYVDLKNKKVEHKKSKAVFDIHEGVVINIERLPVKTARPELPKLVMEAAVVWRSEILAADGAQYVATQIESNKLVGFITNP